MIVKIVSSVEFVFLQTRVVDDRERRRSVTTMTRRTASRPCPTWQRHTRRSGRPNHFTYDEKGRLTMRTGYGDMNEQPLNYSS